MSETPLQWHPAFCAALQIELEGENLQFHFEYNLTQKPLQIDALVIQKDPFVRIKKSFGRMFRTHNIVEYKSPDDYLSINDYFKVLGYAAIYQANTEKILEIRPEDITITMVTNHYPRDMIKYLTKLYIKHGVSVNQMYPGIYYLYGLTFPTQILVTKELSSEETVWMSRLRPGLDTTKDGDVLISNYQGKDTIPTYAAFMDVVVRSNEHCFKKEENNMCDAIMELMAGPLQKREEKGEALAKIKQICKKIQKQVPIADIADMIEEDLNFVEQICSIAPHFAPDYPAEDIYNKWMETKEKNLNI